MTSAVPLPDPVAVQVVRWKCPGCSRSANRPGRAREHIARCWYVPENRGCKTCRWFERDYEGGEYCDVGVDLSGRPACKTCAGSGWISDSGIGASCPDCDNSPEVRDGIKAGPIIHCDLWKNRDEETDDA